MYVVNGKEVLTLLDISVTHNFVATSRALIVVWLLRRVCVGVKALSSATQLVGGVNKATMKVGD